jgi:hypothetical protein
MPQTGVMPVNENFVIDRKILVLENRVNLRPLNRYGNKFPCLFLNLINCRQGGTFVDTSNSICKLSTGDFSDWRSP